MFTLPRAAILLSTAAHVAGLAWLARAPTLTLAQGGGTGLSVVTLQAPRRPESHGVRRAPIRNPGREMVREIDRHGVLPGAIRAAESPGAPAAAGPAGDALASAASLGIRATYPALSRRLGEEGRVTVEIAQIGARLEPKLADPSGFARLNVAAIAAMRAALADPRFAAQVAPGARIAFVFKLD